MLGAYPTIIAVIPSKMTNMEFQGEVVNLYR